MFWDYWDIGVVFYFFVISKYDSMTSCYKKSLSIWVTNITFLSDSRTGVLSAKKPFVLFPVVYTTPAIFKHFPFIWFLQNIGKAVWGSHRTGCIFSIIGL